MNTYQRFQIPVGFAQKYCSEGSVYLIALQ